MPQDSSKYGVNLLVTKIVEWKLDELEKIADKNIYAKLGEHGGSLRVDCISKITTTAPVFGYFCQSVAD